MIEILKALALEFGDYRTFGYRVERASDRWMLLDPDGGSLFIGSEGGSSIRKESAVLEAYRRIAQDAGGASVFIRSLYRDARDLITEPGDENPEYDRGVAELLACADPIEDLPLAERAAQILAELRTMTVPA